MDTSAPFAAQIKAARRAGVPLLRVPSADIPALEREAADAIGYRVGLLRWSPAGLAALNNAGKGTLAQVSQDDRDASTNPLAMLETAAKLPPDTMVLAWNLYAYAPQLGPALDSMVLALREPYKASRRILASVGAGSTPDALQQDVMTLTHPLPDDAALEKIIKDIHASAKVPVNPDDLSRAVDSVRGLYAYAAESIISTSISKEGLDLAACWRGKAEALPRGLSLEMLTEIPPIGGLTALIDYIGGRFNGPRAPRALLWMDEIEKMLGGLGVDGGPGDNTGVTQDILGSLLRWMDGGYGRRRGTGVITVGAPGTGKSLTAQVLAARHRIPLLTLDLGSVKGSLVGQTEQAIRAALAAVDRISGGDVYVYATCNNLSILPPELRRRFTDGVAFVDLPARADLDAIWPLQLAQHDIPATTPRPDDTRWTGSDIRSCCASARDRGWTLQAAARFLTPVAKTDAARIERLRDQAHGRFLDASTGGLYTRQDVTASNVTSVTVSRQILTNEKEN